MNLPRNSELENIKDKIIQIFKENPETRNNDLLLQWIYFKKYEGVEMPVLSYPQLRELEGRLEGIRRMRQIIQNVDKMYPPTRIDILKKRRMKEEDYHAFFAKYGEGD
jgi:translation elongation factor EF-Tu-like GTPase